MHDRDHKFEFLSGADAIDRATRLMKGELRTAFGIGFFLNLLVLSTPIYMLQIFDRVLATGHSETLLYLTLMVVFALVIFGLLEGQRSRILTRLGFALEGMLRDSAVSAWMVTSRKRGAARNPPVSDLQALRSFLQGPGPAAICDAPWAPLFIVVLFLLHPLIGLIGLGGSIVLIAFALLNERAAGQSIKEAQAARAVATDLGHSAVLNSDTVASLGMARNIEDRFGAISNKAVFSELLSLDRSAAIVAGTKATRLALQVMVLGVGAWLVLQNQLTAGGMIAGSIILSRALAPAEQSIGAWRSFVPVREAWKRLKENIGTLPKQESSVKLSRPNGPLTVEGLFYSAEQDAPDILSDINFELQPGESCAILGPTGAGKSTLCRLIVGAQFPTKGQIRLDDVEIHGWPESERGEYVGYLPQDVDVLLGTVAENICRFSEPDSEQILETAKLAGINRLVMRLPEGFDTRVGPGGLRLSGGQKQRIGLARALYKSPRLIVLDEPNSNLDQDGERALETAISAMKAAGAIVLIVVHKGNLLGITDKILMLRDGKQDGFGDRQSLLRALESQRRVVPMSDARAVNLTSNLPGEQG